MIKCRFLNDNYERASEVLQMREVDDAQSVAAASPTNVAEIALTGHEKHCFVVMPSGREPSEQKWFKGWYEVVLKPAIAETGYEPVLAAAEEQPGAINDEIRAHLAIDPMVVVDLAGAEPEDDPNPNVMYELGIRHALGLPLVMMAWKGQRLPFDVGNQRVIMEDRDLIDLDLNRKKLVSFIRAAQQGRYYRPMEAVSRIATIQAASESLSQDSVLRAMAQEMREFRNTFESDRFKKFRKPKSTAITVKTLIGGKVFRKELYPHFTACGGNSSTWARFLRTQIPPEHVTNYQGWTLQDWKEFVAQQASELSGKPQEFKPAPKPTDLDASILLQVREMLPPQPWPTGIHKEIADKLDLPPSIVTKCIAELIRLGEFMEQIEGQIIPKSDSAANPPA